MRTTDKSSCVPYLRANELIVPSIPLGEACFRPWMCQFLRDAFLTKDIEGETNFSGRRLYISRGLAGYRRVLNEPEVIQFLRRRGFEEIKFERLSVRQQAATMAACEVVVAPHGGGLSNLVFCSPGTKVIRIFSPELVAGFFWKISNQLGLDYYYLLGKGHSTTRDPDYLQSWDARTDIEVDLDVLEFLIWPMFARAIIAAHLHQSRSECDFNSRSPEGASNARHEADRENGVRAAGYGQNPWDRDYYDPIARALLRPGPFRPCCG